MFALFGIGRHHPDATPAPDFVTHAISVVQGVPVAVWVALIGLASAVAGPVAAHLLEKRRTKG